MKLVANSSWKNSLKKDANYLFSFLFIDRAASTKDFDYYPPTQVHKRSQLFHSVVGKKIRSFGGQISAWSGDATTAFFFLSQPQSIIDRARRLATIAVQAAISIRKELAKQEELRTYMSVDVAFLPFRKELGKIKNLHLDVAGHILKVCPPDSLLAHEDLWMLLDRDLQAKFRYCGTTVRDRAAVFIHPRQRGQGVENKAQFVSEKSDTHFLKEKYLEFLKTRHGTLSPRGLRQEHLVSLPLLKVFQPLKLRSWRTEDNTADEIELAEIDQVEIASPVTIKDALAQSLSHPAAPALSTIPL